MIVLMDSNQRSGDELAAKGVPVGQLLTPLTRYRRWSDTWAIDNGAFSEFKAAAFASLLEREYKHRDSCLFVAVPDVVGSARRTLEVWGIMTESIRGWRRALVAQDGIEDLPIPWHQLDAIFIGGSTRFKESTSAMACAKAAKIFGKWVHVGRVNTPQRRERWEGIADSCDGSGLARYSHMREDYAQGLPLIESEEKDGA